MINEKIEDHISHYSYSCKKIDNLIFKFEYDNNDEPRDEIIGYYELKNNLMSVKDQGVIELCMDFNDNSIILYCHSQGMFSKDIDFTRGSLLNNQSFQDYVMDYTLKEDTNHKGKYVLVSATNKYDTSSFMITVDY